MNVIAHFINFYGVTLSSPTQYSSTNSVIVTSSTHLRIASSVCRFASVHVPSRPKYLNSLSQENDALFIMQVALDCIVPVSYTHLDVYKRQVQ